MPTLTPDNPDLMVMGDSLPQGCRSLTVKADFCKQSYPMVAAQFAGLKLSPPDHARPVLLDLEAMALNNLGAIVEILWGISANYDAWKQGFSPGMSNSLSHAEYFDNVAVAGATIEDMLGEATQANGTPGLGTPAQCDQYISTVPHFDLSKLSFKVIGDLHEAINARFVLNPSNLAGYAGYSQMQWVLARQPKNLIVHIGHNNGLWLVGFKGVTADWDAAWGAAKGAPALTKYVNQIIAPLAAGLPNTNIIFLGLPKIGAVSNLMPYPDATGPRLAADPNYYANYQTQFLSLTTVPGDVIRGVDQRLVAVNNQIKAAVVAADAGRNRLQFFDMYGFFEQHDTKNLGKPSAQISTYAIDNDYLKGDFKAGPSTGVGRVPSPPKWQFADGGFQSIDGMHATSIGYAELGLAIANTLMPKTPVPSDKQAHFLAKTLFAENMVVNFPQGLYTVLDIIHSQNASTQPPDAKAVANCIHGMSQAF